MVKITIGSKEYKLPTNWNDISLDRIVDCSNPKEELSILGNIPPKIINILTSDQLFSLYQIIDFIHDHDSLNGLLLETNPEATYKGETGPVVEYSSWDKLNQAKKAFDPQFHKTYYNLCKIYYPEEKNTIKILSLGYKILEQINSFLANYEEMFNEPYTQEEIDAGVEELQYFDIFGTVFTMAGENILKMDEILAMPAVTIYTALYYSFKKRKYQDRLIELRTKK